MKQYEDLNFDNDETDLIQIPVTYKGQRYILTEAFGDAVAQWRNAQLAGTTMHQTGDSEDKTIRLGGMADSEPLLVSLCLFNPGPDGRLPINAHGNVDSRNRVPLSVVRGWPNRVVGKLFETVKKISGLDQTETVESLDKKIAELQRRKTKLQKSKEHTEEEALAKNSQPGGTAGSESAES